MQTESLDTEEQSDAVESIPGCPMVGAGFNIFKRYDSSSTKSALFQMGDLDHDHVTLGKKTYAVPRNISVMPDRERNAKTNVFSSREELQKHFSTKASVEASAFGFSGQVDASYAKTTKSTQDYFYALTEMSSRAYTMSLRDASKGKLMLSVVLEMAALPKEFNAETEEAFFAFFERYGTHYVEKVSMGARLYFCTAVTKSFASSEKEIELKVKLEYDGTFASSKAESESKWKELDKNWQQNRSATVSTKGGDDSILDALVPEVGKWSGDKMKDWNASLEDKPGEVDFTLASIAQIFSYPKSKQVSLALEKYINGNISAKAYARTGIMDRQIVDVYPIISCANVTVPVIEPKPDSKPGERNAGVQAVLFERGTRAVLYNKTLYAPAISATQVLAMYARLYDDLKKFADRNYYCAISVFGVFSPIYPSAELAEWLKNHGAALEQWGHQIGQTSPNSGFANYCFIGKKGATQGSGKEDFKLYSSSTFTGINSEALARYFLYGGVLTQTAPAMALAGEPVA
jgi:hypothetical protein